MKPQVIIFIYLGGPILHFVKCYSGGNFDSNPVICQTMAVIHDFTLPQDTEPPFKVDPDNITIGPLNVGKSIVVTLKADSPESFIGFMLEARKPGNITPQGIFSLTDTSISRLQQCDGINGKAVTQTDNRPKTEIKVHWEVSETGVYFFRATFVKTYDIFWVANISSSTPTPSSTPDTVTTTTVTTSTSTSTSTILSSVTTTAPPQTFLFESSLTLHLLSYFSLAEYAIFLMKAHVCDWMKVTSFLSLAFSLVAFILLLIDAKQVEGKILAGVAVSLNLCQTILIFFLCGPSHKLRKIFCWVLRVVSSINFFFTIATIYVGIVEHSSKSPSIWPAILMGVYLACQLLSCPFFLYGYLKLKNQQQTASSTQNCRVSSWCTCLVIFSGMNIAFTIAIVLNIFVPLYD